MGGAGDTKQHCARAVFLFLSDVFYGVTSRRQFSHLWDTKVCLVLDLQIPSLPAGPAEDLTSTPNRDMVRRLINSLPPWIIMLLQMCC